MMHLQLEWIGMHMTKLLASLLSTATLLHIHPRFAPEAVPTGGTMGISVCFQADWAVAMERAVKQLDPNNSQQNYQ